MATEKRLIDANAIPYEEHYVPDGDAQWEYKKELCVLKPVIDAMPTEDAVEVVRCKDCKHWKFIDSLNPHWECQIFCGLHDCGYLTGADDFCSYGERRDDV